MPASMPSLFVLAYWLAESTAERAQPASKPTQTLSDCYLNVLDKQREPVLCARLPADSAERETACYFGYCVLWGRESERITRLRAVSG